MSEHLWKRRHERERRVPDEGAIGTCDPTRRPRRSDPTNTWWDSSGQRSCSKSQNVDTKILIIGRHTQLPLDSSRWLPYGEASTPTNDGAEMCVKHLQCTGWQNDNHTTTTRHTNLFVSYVNGILESFSEQFYHAQNTPTTCGLWGQGVAGSVTSTHKTHTHTQGDTVFPNSPDATGLSQF